MNRNSNNISNYIDESYRSLDYLRRSLSLISNRYTSTAQNQGSTFGFDSANIREILQAYTRMYNSTIQHIEFLHGCYQQNQSSFSQQHPNIGSNSSDYVFINGEYFPINQSGNNPSMQPFQNSPLFPNNQPNRNNILNRTRVNNISRSSRPSSRQPTFPNNRQINVQQPLSNSLNQNNRRTDNITRQTSGTNFATHPGVSTFGSRSRTPFNANAQTLEQTLFSPLASMFENVTTDMLSGLTPVVVRPTRDQINRATRVVRYGEIENPLNTQCPISLESFQDASNVVQILNCRHVFQPSSFDQWFNSNVRCPICRFDIRNYRPPPENQEETNLPIEMQPILSPNLDSSNVPEPHQDVSNNNYDENEPYPSLIDTTSTQPVDTSQNIYSQLPLPPPYTPPSNRNTTSQATNDASFIQQNQEMPELDPNRVISDYLQEQINVMQQSGMLPPGISVDLSGVPVLSETTPQEMLNNVSNEILGALFSQGNTEANINADAEEIFSNIFSNNISNVNIDSSNGQITFDTILTNFGAPEFNMNFPQNQQDNNNPGDSNDPDDLGHVD